VQVQRLMAPARVRVMRTDDGVLPITAVRIRTTAAAGANAGERQGCRLWSGGAGEGTDQ
jgi:hypothetical protein